MSLKLTILEKSDNLDLTNLKKIVIKGIDGYEQTLHKSNQDTSEDLDFVLYGLKFKPNCNVGSRFLKSNLLSESLQLPDSLQDPETLGSYLECCLIQDSSNNPIDGRKYFGTFSHSGKLIVILDLEEKARSFEFYNELNTLFLKAEITGSEFDLSVRKVVSVVFSPEGDLRELNLSEVSWDKSKSPLRSQELYYQRSDSKLPDLSRVMEKDGYLFDSITGVLLANRKLSPREYPILSTKLTSARKSLNLRSTYLPGDKVIFKGMEYTCISKVTDPGENLAISPCFVCRDLSVGVKEEFIYVGLPYSPLDLENGKSYLFGEEIECKVDLTKTFRPIVNPTINEVRSPFISDNLENDKSKGDKPDYYQPKLTSPGTTDNTLSNNPSQVNWIWKWTGESTGVLKIIKKPTANLTDTTWRLTSLPVFDNCHSTNLDPRVDFVDSLEISQLTLIFGGLDLRDKDLDSDFEISIVKSIKNENSNSFITNTFSQSQLKELALNWDRLSQINLPEISGVNHNIRSIISSRDYSRKYNSTEFLPHPTDFIVKRNQDISIVINLGKSPYVPSKILDLKVPLSTKSNVVSKYKELEKCEIVTDDRGYRSIRFTINLNKTNGLSKCLYIPLIRLSESYEVKVLDCHGGEVTKLGERVKLGGTFNMKFYPDEFKVFDQDGSIIPEGSVITRDESTGIYDLTINNVQSDLDIKLNFKDENK